MKWCRKIQEGDFVCDDKGSEQPGMSEEKVEQVREGLQHSPSKSTWRPSQELNIPHTTVWKILRQCLRVKPYRILQAIAAADKELRTAFCNEIQERMEGESFQVTNGGHIEHTKAIQFAHLFCYSRSFVSGVQYDVENFLMQLYVWSLSLGKCSDSCSHGCADWEFRRLWSARCYSFSAGRWDLRLSCRRGKYSCEIVLLHDNARPQTARQTQTLLREQFQ